VNIFKRVLKYWLTEYKVDGYRLDLTKRVYSKFRYRVGERFNPELITFTEYYNAAKEVKSDLMFILGAFLCLRRGA